MAIQGTWQGHQIVIETRLSPKNLFLSTETLVKVDGIKIVQLRKLSLGDYAVGTFEHQGVSTPIEIKTKVGLFSQSYSVKIHEKVVMQGYLGTETINMMRLYFGLFGLAYTAPCLNLLIPLHRDIIFQEYDPFWFAAGIVINAIFGILFLYFATSLKYLLRNSLKLIIIVLYTWIGVMIVGTPFAVSDLMNAQNLDWRVGIGLRLIFIWFFGYCVVNCKRLSQEIKYQLESSSH